MQERSVFNCKGGISAGDRPFKPSALQATFGILWTFGTGFICCVIFSSWIAYQSFIVNKTEKCTSKCNGTNLLFVFSLS